MAKTLIEVNKAIYSKTMNEMVELVDVSLLAVEILSRDIPDNIGYFIRNLGYTDQEILFFWLDDEGDHYVGI